MQYSSTLDKHRHFAFLALQKCLLTFSFGLLLTVQTGEMYTVVENGRVVTLKDPGAWGHRHQHNALQISLARTVLAAQRGMGAMGGRGEMGKGGRRP